MALDATMIELTAQRLNRQLTDFRIDKINMPARDEVVLQLRSRTEHCKLLLSARSGSARVHITQEEFENPQTPPSFCMLLRKYLGTGHIIRVRAADSERILFIDFECLNEIGDIVPLMVSVELMGRYSNIVLVAADGRIIDALKRIDFEQSEVRQLMPGLPFSMPPQQAKYPFLRTESAEICSEVRRKSKPLSTALLDSVSGIGPVVCREIAWRVSPSDVDADMLDEVLAQKLQQTITHVQGIAGQAQFFYTVWEESKPIEYSFIPLTHYGSMPQKEYDDPNRLLDDFYAERDRTERLRVRSANLLRQVNSLIDRTERKTATRRIESDNSKKAEQKRLYGELLNANLHMLTKGMKNAEILNYYTGETENIPLEVFKTPAQNAQKYYRDYRKLTTAARILTDLIAEGEAELIWLQTVRYEISQARSEEDFLLIRRELFEEGYLRGFKYKPQKNKKKTADVQRYRTSGGFQILSGRNNIANERLTLHTAQKTDYWFHIKNAPGSHVILLCEANEPSDDDLTQAAVIAAYNSSKKDSDRIEVDYTQVRNVKKPTGSKPGIVIYDKYRTAVVSPDERLAVALAEKKN